jgi:hypothetical protein
VLNPFLCLVLFAVRPKAVGLGSISRRHLAEATKLGLRTLGYKSSAAELALPGSPRIYVQKENRSVKGSWVRRLQDEIFDLFRKDLEIFD